ncbi:hypothetical protein G6F50_014002 [Rhizopus delemar]|uniref:Transglutaminase-like domain-containing protein n=1 Tax=Rhizopus delemar TaxID=936053 RepID=A0A9P6YAB5_9FUNG|nr:hypothetical protein G6F50_014002 [Rhizopus delemar]
MDAHAWAEVWLPQRGWVRVDPTAAVAPERILDTLDDRLQAGTGNPMQQRLLELGQMGDWLRRGWNDLVLSFDARRQQQLLKPFGLADLGPGQLAAGFVIAALLALAWMAWLLARGERERDPLLRAWHRLGDAMHASAWPGIPTKPHGTGRIGYTPSGPTLPSSHSASVSPTRVTLELAPTSLHYCGTCAGIARLPEPPHEHQVLPHRRGHAGPVGLRHGSQAAAGTIQPGLPPRLGRHPAGRHAGPLGRSHHRNQAWPGRDLLPDDLAPAQCQWPPEHHLPAAT